MKSILSDDIRFNIIELLKNDGHNPMNAVGFIIGE